MEINAKLDVDVVALQADDEVTCLLTLTAPTPPQTADHPGETLIVVVDRSGSMQGEPLQSVRTALHSLADRLKPQDTFGVVTFDSEALVQVPARSMADHHLPTVHSLIEAIHAGGTTDLSAGYLLGLSEARRHLSDTGASVILLSDGHANQGITDPVQLGGVASQARGETITTTTIGIGTGYDESLLAELATHGSGSHRFAYTDDDAIAVVSEEAGDLLNKAILNAVARIRPTDEGLIERIGTWQMLPRWVETDADGAKMLVIALGDLYAGEQREVLLRIDVPAIAALGHHHLADIAIEYVALPELVQQTITWPLAVNVVPGDEASGRIPDPTVVTARLLAETTEAKRQATEALGLDDSATAASLLDAQRSRLQDIIVRMELNTPDDVALRDRLDEEAEQLYKLAQGAREREAHMSRKSLMEDLNMEISGKNTYERRQRSRGKRDF